MVKIYLLGADWCGKCSQAKQILEERGIEYEYMDIGKETKIPEIGKEYEIEHLPFFIVVNDNGVVNGIDSVVKVVNLVKNG